MQQRVLYVVTESCYVRTDTSQQSGLSAQPIATLTRLTAIMTDPIIKASQVCSRIRLQSPQTKSLGSTGCTGCRRLSRKGKGVGKLRPCRLNPCREKFPIGTSADCRRAYGLDMSLNSFQERRLSTASKS